MNVHLVVQCANTKESNGVRPLRLRDLPAENLEELASEWNNRVRWHPVSHQAGDLYGGFRWKQIRTAGTHVEAVWILSAGLGLLNAADWVPNYSATFQEHVPDSIARWGSPGPARRRWWNRLTQNTKVEGTRPATLTEVAYTYPGTTFVFAVGLKYLDVIREDLLTMIASDATVILFGSGKPPPGLALSWVKVPVRVRHVLGGGKGAGTVTVAKETLRLLPPEELTVQNARVVAERIAGLVPILPNDKETRAKNLGLGATVRCLDCVILGLYKKECSHARNP